MHMGINGRFNSSGIYPVDWKIFTGVSEDTVASILRV
jgi:hypothetical protein